MAERTTPLLTPPCTPFILAKSTRSTSSLSSQLSSRIETCGISARRRSEGLRGSIMCRFAPFTFSTGNIVLRPLTPPSGTPLPTELLPPPAPLLSLCSARLVSACDSCLSLRIISLTSCSASRKNCSVSVRWLRMVAARDFMLRSSLFLICTSRRRPAASSVASCSSLATDCLSSLALTLNLSTFSCCCLSNSSTRSRSALISLVRMCACLAYSTSFSANMFMSLLASVRSASMTDFSAWLSAASLWWNFSSSNMRLLSARIFLASSPMAERASSSATSLKAAFCSSSSLNSTAFSSRKRLSCSSMASISCSLWFCRFLSRRAMAPSCSSLACLKAYTAFSSDSALSSLSASVLIVLSELVRISASSSSKDLRTFTTSNFSCVWHFTSSSFSRRITSSLISISRWKYSTMSCVSFSFWPELVRSSLLLLISSSTRFARKFIFSWSSCLDIWKDGGKAACSIVLERRGETRCFAKGIYATVRRLGGLAGCGHRLGAPRESCLAIFRSLTCTQGKRMICWPFET
mmetsp:Transcript_784/g.1733  ORF Transcript_784/g.1733 Transcript_784/m.1733 type:complete len:522 (+) Transcript_784:341-1906(+)